MKSEALNKIFSEFYQIELNGPILDIFHLKSQASF